MILLVAFAPTAFAIQAPKSQAEPYGFKGDRLRMSIAEFKTKHPALTNRDCGDEGNGVIRCDYSDKMADLSLGSGMSIPIGVSSMFIDGKLALIQVKPPNDTYACFDPRETSNGYFDSASCKPYRNFWQTLTGTLGTATTVISLDHQELHAQRWENDVSVAEFQNHMCGPWDGSNKGWSKAILEVLEGSYCAKGDNQSARYNAMFYLDKELSRALAIRLRDTSK